MRGLRESGRCRRTEAITTERSVHSRCRLGTAGMTMAVFVVGILPLGPRFVVIVAIRPLRVEGDRARAPNTKPTSLERALTRCFLRGGRDLIRLPLLDRDRHVVRRPKDSLSVLIDRREKLWVFVSAHEDAHLL